MSEAHQGGGGLQVVQPMLVVAFAVESMGGAVVFAGLAARVRGAGGCVG
ncbi:MAG: hypothetical protein ACK5Q5_23080 [Planctomycetaceae bacterium]